MRTWIISVAFFGFILLLSHAEDTIRPNEVLGMNETLVSAGGIFELGFFEHAISGCRFLGIWLKNDVQKKAVWVANRDNPLLDSSGTLHIREDGNLILLDKRQTPIIVNSGALATIENTTATLDDSGNLVLRQGNEVIWQSFDYPSDTYLPGMKIGLFGLKTGVPRIRMLVSWWSPDNPVCGEFILGVEAIDHKAVTKLSLWRGDRAHLNVSSWDGQSFGFMFENSSNSFHFACVSNENETYFNFSTTGNYDLSWLTISSIGHIDEYTMSNGNISSVSHSLCENSIAGNSNICSPLEPSQCKDGDAFMAVNGSLPTAMTGNGLISVVFSECEFMCRNNCSCVAFASLQDNQTVCQLYYGDKVELLNNLGKGEGVVYVRGTASNQQGSEKNRRLLWILAASLSPLVMTIVLFLWCHTRGPGNWQKELEAVSRDPQVTPLELNPYYVASFKVRAANNLDLGNDNDQDLTVFSFPMIETSTEHFATKNKLGEGGFGPVYKGKLAQGQEIAVKRLSKRSGQGLKEFKNEVELISKLQHRNLVRLLGCCIQGDENILIYEYMPNRSLDLFLFDSTKRTLLDWRKRVNIIEGIAQGLLYLHKYSRLRIIHCDLKASNILLDCDKNPKISDFGMARIFEENETRAKTSKISGTYGYMSPEYAMDGLFSEKSDVFSFGIIVLEIISGQKNMAFFESDQSLNLIGHAWNLWKEGKSMELVDSILADCCVENEVLLCHQLGLLCVQDRAADRPTISDVICMLRNGTITPPHPKEPSFLSQVTSFDADSCQRRYGYCSKNRITVSEVFPR